MEVWKRYRDTKYKVSNFGILKSFHIRANGFILKGNIDRCGYVRVVLSPKKNRVFLHAMVAECFLGPKPYGEQVNHLDGDKKNNNVNNLEYVTQSENVTHAYKNGLMKAGEGHYQSIFSNDIARKIRKLSFEGMKTYEIAKSLGANYHTVWGIVKGRTYANV